MSIHHYGKADLTDSDHTLLSVKGMLQTAFTACCSLVFRKDPCDAKHVSDVEKMRVKSDSFTLGSFGGEKWTGVKWTWQFYSWYIWGGGGKTGLNKKDLAVLLLAVLGGGKIDLTYTNTNFPSYLSPFSP